MQVGPVLRRAVWPVLAVVTCFGSWFEWSLHPTWRYALMTTEEVDRCLASDIDQGPDEDEPDGCLRDQLRSVKPPRPPLRPPSWPSNGPARSPPRARLRARQYWCPNVLLLSFVPSSPPDPHCHPSNIPRGRTVGTTVTALPSVVVGVMRCRGPGPWGDWGTGARGHGARRPSFDVVARYRHTCIHSPHNKLSLVLLSPLFSSFFSLSLSLARSRARAHTRTLFCRCPCRSLSLALALALALGPSVSRSLSLFQVWGVGPGRTGGRPRGPGGQVDRGVHQLHVPEHLVRAVAGWPLLDLRGAAVPEHAGRGGLDHRAAV